MWMMAGAINHLMTFPHMQGWVGCASKLDFKESGVNARFKGALRSRGIVVQIMLWVLALICTEVTSLGVGLPEITVQPQDQFANTTSNAVFAVTATGDGPLKYQWRAGGISGSQTNISRGTNATLVMSNVNLLTPRLYSVVVSNAVGAVTSSVALLNLDPDSTFRVLALRTNGYIALEVNSLVGDDRGGMAVSSNNVFLTGDNTTGRWRKQDLTGGTSVGQSYNALTTDLRTEKAYTLANGGTPLSSSGTVTALLEISDTGALTGNRINLSTSIALSFSAGIYAGYGRIVLHDAGNTAQVYNIDLPSGRVTALGQLFISRNGAENWATWGIAEFSKGELYLLYGQSCCIGRTRVSDSVFTTAASFSQGLSDLASFTFSPSLSRWFFHYEGFGAFGNRDETLGSAKALFTTNVGFPEIVQQPLSQTVYADAPATVSVIATGSELTYQWSLNGTEITDATNATLLLQSVVPADQGEYTVTISSSGVSIRSEPAHLSVISTPFINWGPFDQYVNATESIRFEVGADGSRPLFFYWRYGGDGTNPPVDILRTTNSFLDLTNVQPQQEGFYSVMASNAYGVTVSASAFLTVNTQVFIFNEPVDTAIFVGEPISFTLGTNGAPPISLQWFLNGVPIADETGPTFYRPSSTPADEGFYTLVASNPWMSVTSAPAFLRVITEPAILDQPFREVVFAGDSATFSVGAYGPGTLGYQWWFNGTAISNATDPSISLTNITVAQVGLYSVVVSNSYGSVTSAPASLTITNPLPEGASFRIVALTTNNSRFVANADLTGDDRGGVAASLTHFFYSGDFSTAGFKTSDLSEGNRVGTTNFNPVYDSMVSDLRTAKAYLLGTTNSFQIQCCGFTATKLVELNSQTGETNGNTIELSTPIAFPPFFDGNVAFFSGYGRILVYNTTNVYSIVLPTGGTASATVSNLGAMSIPQHVFSDGWAYWGVAEYYRGTNYLVYVKDFQNIVRTRVPDGLTTTVGMFSNLGDMASFTVSPFYNRWYFHQQFGGDFTPIYETVGFADAVVEVSPVDHYEWSVIPSPQVIGAPISVTLTAKSVENRTVTNFSGTVALSAVVNGAGAIIPVTPGTSAQFVNGIWTGHVVIDQALFPVQLVATDSFGNTGTSTPFAVLPLNDLFVTLVDAPDPIVVGQQLSYTITVSNTGPAVATGVMVTNVLPSNIIFESVITSTGACTNADGIVSCELGTVPGMNGVTIVINVRPTAVGVITNTVTIVRGEADSDSTDDSAVALSNVTLPALSVIDASIVEQNSGTNLITVNVILSAPSTNIVTVNYLTFNGTANTSDYVSTNGTLTFAPGETSQPIQVRVRGDTLYETNETFNVGLNTPVNASLARNNGVVTIINDDAAPIVSIADATLVEGNSGTNNSMAFRVSLSAPTGLQILINWSTTNGTTGVPAAPPATPDVDYFSRAGAIIFAAGTATLTQTVNIAIVGDTIAESNEVFYVNLTSISNAVGGKVEAVGTIIADDGIGVVNHFSFEPIAPAQAVNTPFGVTITAKDFFNTTISNFIGPVSLSTVVQKGEPTNSILGEIINPNSASGNWTLGYSFTPNRDLTVTHFRRYFGVKASIWTDTGTLVLSAPFSGTDGVWTNVPLAQPVTLTKGTRYRIAAYTGGGNYYWRNDGISTFKDGTIDEGYESSGDAFPTFADGIHWMIDLIYSTESFLPMSPTNSGTFARGVWFGNVTVLGAGTNVALRARDAAGNVGESALFDAIPADISVTILDTPDPVVVNDLLTYSILVTNTGPTDATGVILSNVVPSSVIVQDIATDRGTCANQGGVLRCDLGTMTAATSASITIRVIPTALGTITNSVSIVRSEIDSYPSNNTATALTTVTLPTLFIEDASIVEGNSGTNLLTFSVNMTGRSTNTISVNYLTFNGTASSSTDYVSTNGTLTFAPGVTNQIIQVRVRGDTLYETNEIFNLSINTPVNAIISRGSAIGTIINDDAPPTVSLIADASLVEGNTGTNNMAFRVRLSGPTGLQILVSYSTSNGTATAGSDYLPLNSVLSFGANTLTLTQTINVPILGETRAEFDEFFYLNLTSISNALGSRIQAIGTITNDDGFGVLDHFVFDPIGSPQGVDLPFPVTITAKDFFGATVTNFNQTTEISGLIPSGRPTNYILGNVLPDNNGNSCCYTLGYSFTPTNDLTLTHFRPYFGSKVSLWQEDGTLLASVIHSNTPGSWSEVPLDAPLKLLAGTRYRIGAYNAGVNNSYYWSFILPSIFPDGTIDQSYEQFGDTFPNQADSVRWWYVDLRYTLDFPVSVTPTNSGTFTNGLWRGSVAVSTAGSNVVVRARDAAQHTGDSGRFRVVPSDQADLNIALVPVAQPALALPQVRFISNFVFSIQVSNAGPANATQVLVSNALPAQVQFLSLLGPEGSCFYSNGAVVCSIGTLLPRSGVEVVVTTRPLEAGLASTFARVRGSETDPNTLDNLTIAQVSICRDCDGDGMWDDWEFAHGLNPFQQSDGALDNDHDGHSNLQEFLAGTDPNSSNSLTRISEVLLSGNDVRLRFHGVAGKRYQLERSEEMNGPSTWKAIVIFKVGSSQVVDLIDSSAMRRTNSFYRVRLLN
jgi:uncharacterized repeat protein (TIGR01451 family)